MTTHRTRHDYLPAMGHDWLLPLYDTLTRLVGVPAAHRLLLEHAGIQAAQRVLEVGCGTANLALLTRRSHPGADVAGLDPDPKALERARRKSNRQRLPVRLDRGFAEELPYRDATFDRVLSAFMFHHLDRAQKAAMLREVRRVLEPGGALVLGDIGGAADPSDGYLARRSHRSALLQDNFGDGVPVLLRETGFVDAAEVAHRVTVVGRFTVWRATVGPASR